MPTLAGAPNSTLEPSDVPRLARRALITWAIEAAALGLLDRVLPGVRIVDLAMTAIAALVIGALNALVRPIVILLAVNLGVVPFTIVALLANGAMVILATRLVPGFSIDGPWTALLLAFGLAILNALISSLLGINDDDSFYRNVVRWAERRQLSPSDLDEPGTILVQIDGLAEPILRSELDAGHLPTLQRWLSSRKYQLVGWECDLPSMTSSGQAGILYGNNANIPAFRWFEKDSARLLVSNHPRDAHVIDQRQTTDHALLRKNGSSVGNIFSGAAEHCVVTMSRLTSDSGQFSTRSRDLYDYFVNPYNLYRAIGAMAWEIVVELWEAWRQRLARVEPRMDRGGTYPLVRAIVSVLLRDITTWMLVADMFAGRRVAYADYLGYDEVAHHAGPATADALRLLRKIDAQLRQLESAARLAPREYQFVILSDHGQSSGATFRQRFGITLDQLVHQLALPARAPGSVHLAGGSGEGTGQVGALLSDAVRLAGAVGHGARWLARHTPLSRNESEPHPGEAAAVHLARHDVVVCASGNLALVYFTRVPSRLTSEAIDRAYPGLLDKLVRHDGIGFVLVASEKAGGPVVLGRHGRRVLNDGTVVGTDPLRGLSPHTAEFLRRLSTYPNVGDIVVNSLWEPDTGRVAAFEELIGCHGGAGGAQTKPFVLYPSAWGNPPSSILGSEQLHAFLRNHLTSSASRTGHVKVGQNRQVI